MVIHSFVEQRIAQMSPCGATLAMRIAGQEYVVSTIRFGGQSYTRVIHGNIVVHYDGEVDTYEAASRLHEERRVYG